MLGSYESDGSPFQVWGIVGRSWEGLYQGRMERSEWRVVERTESGHRELGPTCNRNEPLEIFVWLFNWDEGF